MSHQDNLAVFQRSVLILSYQLSMQSQVVLIDLQSSILYNCPADNIRLEINVLCIYQILSVCIKNSLHPQYKGCLGNSSVLETNYTFQIAVGFQELISR